MPRNCIAYSFEELQKIIAAHATATTGETITPAQVITFYTPPPVPGDDTVLIAAIERPSP